MTADQASATMPSPIGTLTVAVSSAGVRAVWWNDDPRPIRGESAGEANSRQRQLLERTQQQLGEYFAGVRTEFDLPLDPLGTPFQRAAWEVLRTIPFGATITYAAQATALGGANKARAAGAANGRNPIGIIVPCHRVVGANGALTGFAGGLDTKAWLLDHERRVLAITR
jgi:methylated-DNA-[protein]-cysteine S-methyltransferase